MAVRAILCLTTILCSASLHAEDLVPAPEPLAAENPNPTPIPPNDAPPAAVAPAPDGTSSPEPEPAATAPKALRAPSPLDGFRGLLGAPVGCLAGIAPATAILGAGGAFMYWLYGQAAVGACTGIQPALVSLGVAGTMCGAAFVAPVCGAGGATLGAAAAATDEGRSPMPAVCGGSPGIALAVVSAGLGVTTIVVGTAIGLAGAQVTLGLLGLTALVGVCAPTCSMVGAGVADAIAAHMPAPPPDETAPPAPATQQAAMRF